MPLLELTCPCCKSTLVVDPETAAVLRHAKPRSRRAGPDLQAAVAGLRREERTRSERFAKQFEAEERQSANRSKRFEGLLAKARSEPAGPGRRRADGKGPRD